jgi:hypothetical protein
LLFDCCGVRIRDGSDEIRPFVDDTLEWGTGIERDGNPIVSDGDLGLGRFICVGLIKDGELTTMSESVVVVSSIFLTFSFDFFGFLLVISLS